eukprot:CAMPEP_0204272404 /NCGR_PEP_ID=MMETSP0468-20130131/22064_1 /ASSEMBLY_ACC=CAM_ASM_000383 /TAXON_ID=2969 /ORGANISM="Oxyrrhis marina" /LENGTH=339 /DNA_ID=CAMNT_0051248241 /DNA_START=42 /DNA_END=1061 /DNA_ORIENTATION=-
MAFALSQPRIVSQPRVVAGSQPQTVVSSRPQMMTGSVTYSQPRLQGSPQYVSSGPQVIRQAPGGLLQSQPRIVSGPVRTVVGGSPATRVVRAGAQVSKPQWVMRLGATVPNFQCETTQGNFTFHEFCDSDPARPWTVLVSHPADYTPVCTTELGRCDTLSGAFAERGIKLIGVSCDSVDDHLGWTQDILYREQREDQGQLTFPIIADKDRSIVTTLGMLDPLEQNAAGLAMPARALVVVDAEKKVRLSILYPATTGRSFEEVFRVIDSLQLTSDLQLATPVDWIPGQPCIVAPSVSTEDASQRFSNLQIESLPSGKEYIRFVDCPGAEQDPANQPDQAE